MKKFYLFVVLSIFLSGCVTMDLQPGMSITSVNSEFWVYCNKGDQKGQHILLKGKYEHDPSILVYQSNPATKRHKENYEQCEKILYFKDDRLVPDQNIKDLETKAEKRKAELQAKVEIKKDLMNAFIKKNALQVLEKFKGLKDDSFKIYTNSSKQLFYSINYEFVDSQFVSKEIATHEQEERDIFARSENEKNRLIQIESQRFIMKTQREKEESDRKENQRNVASKIIAMRNVARDNLVSQALNYSSGYPEDSSGNSFFYPVDLKGGQCVFEFVNYNSYGDILTPGLDNGKKIDLNKGNPRTVKVTKTTRKIPFTASLYADYYQTTIEGLGSPFASCDRCDPDRIYRAWNLIYSKCSGKKVNF